MSPLTLAALRFIIGGLALLLLALYWRQAITLRVLQAACIPGIALAFGLVMMVVGLQTAQSSVAAFLVCSDAFFIPVVDWLLYRRRADKMVLSGLGIGGAGLAFLSYSGSVEISVGTWWLLGASVVWAVYYSTVGHVAARFGSVALCCCAHIVAGVTLLLLFSPLGALSPTISAKTWWLVLYIAVVISAVRFALMTKVQSVIPSPEMGLIGLLEPVAAAVVGIAFANEWLSFSQWIGACLVLFAVAMPLLSGVRRRRVGPPLP
jgi:drug/metabolite transporter (DMT)-like permease